MDYRRFGQKLCDCPYHIKTNSTNTITALTEFSRNSQSISDFKKFKSVLKTVQVDSQKTSKLGRTIFHTSIDIFTSRLQSFPCCCISTSLVHLHRQYVVPPEHPPTYIDSTWSPQCVELALRWQFCVHGNICHEIYFQRPQERRLNKALCVLQAYFRLSHSRIKSHYFSGFPIKLVYRS